MKIQVKSPAINLPDGNNKKRRWRGVEIEHGYPTPVASFEIVNTGAVFSSGSVSSLELTFDATCQSGNLIVLFWGNRTSDNPTTPTGYSVEAGATTHGGGTSARTLAMFTKTSDGTESRVTVNVNGSHCGLAYAEISGWTSITQSKLIDSNSATFDSNTATDSICLGYAYTRHANGYSAFTGGFSQLEKVDGTQNDDLALGNDVGDGTALTCSWTGSGATTKYSTGIIEIT